MLINKVKYWILLLSVFLSFSLKAQEFTPNSVLATGDFYQIEVDSSGIYIISYQYLQENGIDVTTIEPDQIQLFGIPAGMLPQSIDATYLDDPKELAIHVEGAGDSSFDPADYILFYAQGPHRQVFDPQLRQVSVDVHSYSDQSYYFLRLNHEPGKRVGVATSNSNLPASKIFTYHDYRFFEDDHRNILNSGRDWVGADFQAQNGELSILWDDLHLAENSTVAVAVRAVSTAGSDMEIGLAMEGVEIGSFKIPRLLKLAYGYKAIGRTGDFSISEAALPKQNQLEMKLRLNATSGESVFLDHILLNFEQKLLYAGKPFQFQSFQTQQQEANAYYLTNKVEDHEAIIWNVTDLFNAEKQKYYRVDSFMVFNRAGSEMENFVVFEPSDSPVPVFIGKVDNQNLHALKNTDLLIITHETLLAEAMRLADFKNSHDRLNTTVVTTRQIFNEYSGGRQDVTAIRNMVRELFSEHGLQFVLLFGDATYDYKNISSTGELANLVPTYESRNSFHNINSYASDDYYTFMESHEGEWKESGYQLSDHTMDLAIGRLPVANLTEARNVVDKIIHYSSATATFGSWRSQLLFLADDGDENKHQYQSDYLASMVEDSLPRLLPDRVFIDRYPQEKLGGGKERAPQVQEKLDQKIKEGVLMVDFIGHGAENAWTDEFIFTSDMIDDWNNFDQMPLFLTATCEFGRYDDWRKRSGAEKLVLRKEGGAIALLTTTRPVFFTTNFTLSSAFYETLIAMVPDKDLYIGEIFRITKNKSIEGVINRNFTLLGDPSLKLALPQDDIIVDQAIASTRIETDSINWLDINFSGYLSKNESPANYNGFIEYNLFDQKTIFRTLGNEASDQQVEFSNREVIIGKGKTPVVNNRFSFNLLVPELLLNDPGLGKLHLYAYDAGQERNAASGILTFQPDTTLLTDGSDTIPPVITFYLESQKLGDQANLFNQDLLTINISDNFGIRLSTIDTVSFIQGTLSGDPTYRFDHLDSEFIPEPGSIREGTIDIPMNQFQTGLYQLQISAVDYGGNQSVNNLMILLTDKDLLTVYPNPIRNQAFFRLELPDPSLNYQVSFSLVEPTGRRVIMQQMVPQDRDVFTFNFVRSMSGKILQSGMYTYEIIVEAEGYRNRHTGKVMILN